MLEKVCTKCGQLKFINAFSMRTKSTPYAQCRQCRAETSRVREKEIKTHRDFHPGTQSKSLVGPLVCGSCRRSIRKASIRGGYLCRDCMPSANHQAQSACETCRNMDACRERVTLGAWVMCERPDASDIARIQAMGHEVSDGVITFRTDMLLAVRGHLREADREYTHMEIDYDLAKEM